MYPSSFEELIGAFQKLPGVGAKTAERYAFAFLNWNKQEAQDFISQLQQAKEMKHCKICGNLSSDDVCSICSDESRDHSLICVVETPKDLNSIEQMEEFHGVYHILNGTINIQKGILPDSLNIESLKGRIKPDTKEVILALNPNMAGETTSLYISRMLNGLTKVTRLASGIPIGGNLDYVDSLTLKKAFEGRTKTED